MGVERRLSVSCQHDAGHQDHLNGTILTIEEISAAGGVLGRQLAYKVVDTDLLTPEGMQAGFKKLVDEKVHAFSSPFVLAINPAKGAPSTITPVWI